MKIFRYYVVVALVVFGLVVTACAAPPKSGPAPQQPSATPPTPSAPQLTREQQLIEGAKKEGQVVFWTHSWLDSEDSFKKAFQAKYPFLKLTTWEGSPADIDRVVEEAKVGKHNIDVAIYPDVNLPPWLDNGILLDYEWPETKGWVGQPAHNFWRIISVAPMGPVYNTKLLSAAEAPTTYAAMKDAKWRGRSLISTSGHVTPLITGYFMGGGKLDWEQSVKFWKDVVDTARPRTVRGFTAPLELVSAGEMPLFMWSSFKSTVRYIWMGAPLGMAGPKTTSGTNDSIVVMKNAPHPNAAKLLADFFTSEGLITYADKNAAWVPHPELGKRAKMNQEMTKWGFEVMVLPQDVMTIPNMNRALEFWTKELLR
ncbi:MAG: fbpA 2 [Dehalococcoidia bacterium]|nr:fbpA 2 [Dehalococcoidia bacterium]